MAFLQSAPRREPFLTAPKSVLALIAALAAAHVARVVAPAQISERILIDYAFIPARYLPDASDPGSLLERAAPFATHMFLHANFTHLVINCLWLLAFGPVVARRFGPALFLLLFVLCGIAGAATHLALNWGSGAPVIGASGAISGLMAAGIRMLGPRTLAGDTRFHPLASIFSRQVLLFSTLWLGTNLLAGLSGMGMGNEVVTIAWQAHLGGFFAGLFLASLFERVGRRADFPGKPLET